MQGQKPQRENRSHRCESPGSSSYGWPRARCWNSPPRNIGTILIIPDNDASGMGELIALSKLNNIPRSRIHRLPDNFKDVGKLIESWLPTCDEKELRKRLVNWLDPHGLGMFSVKRIDPDA